MKLNKNFIMHTMDGETVVVPTAEAGFHGLIQGNKSVEAILQCLEHDTTEEEILKNLTERFDGDESLMRADIRDVVSRLKKIGAIDE